MEGTILPVDSAFASNPYVLSKWISEQFVARAARQGLPVVITKPGMISGHSSSGACNTSTH